MQVGRLHCAKTVQLMCSCSFAGDTIASTNMLAAVLCIWNHNAGLDDQNRAAVLTVLQGLVQVYPGIL